MESPQRPTDRPRLCIVDARTSLLGPTSEEVVGLAQLVAEKCNIEIPAALGGLLRVSGPRSIC